MELRLHPYEHRVLCVDASIVYTTMGNVLSMQRLPSTTSRPIFTMLETYHAGYAHWDDFLLHTAGNLRMFRAGELLWRLQVDRSTFIRQYGTNLVIFDFSGHMCFVDWNTGRTSYNRTQFSTAGSSYITVACKAGVLIEMLDYNNYSCLYPWYTDRHHVVPPGYRFDMKRQAFTLKVDRSTYTYSCTPPFRPLHTCVPLDTLVREARYVYVGRTHLRDLYWRERRTAVNAALLAGRLLPDLVTLIVGMSGSTP